MAYKSMTDEEILEKVKELRHNVEMGNTDLFERMRKGSQFTYGDQWDPRTRKLNDQRRKFTLQIPLIKPIINQVVGTQIQNPKDLKVAANRGGSHVGAKLLTKLAKHALDSEHAMFENSAWFEAGLANEVSFLHVSIDKNTDPRQGNLVFEKMNEFECGLDPDCSVYDINSFYHGAKCFVWEPWVDKDLVEVEYPDKKAELGESGVALVPGDETGVWSWLWGGIQKVAGMLTSFETTRNELLHKNKYQMSHTWWRRPKKCVMLYDENDNELDSQLFTSDKDIKAARKRAKDEDGVEVEEVIRNIMCHTIRVGDVLLKHTEDELNGVEMFPVAVFSAYFDNGFRSGMATDLIGTQEEINFTHSQQLNILKKMPNWGYIMKDPKPGYDTEIEQKGSMDGIILNEAKAGGPITQLQPTAGAFAYDRFKEDSIRNMHLISGVRSEDAAHDKAGLSGKALIAKQAASQTGNAPVLKRYDYSTIILYNLVIEIIRNNQIYSLDEILEIVDAEELEKSEFMAKAIEMVIEELRSQGIELPGEPAPPDPNIAAQDHRYAESFDMEIGMLRRIGPILEELARPVAHMMMMDEISNLKKGRYNSKVTLSPYAPTMRLAERAEAMDLNAELLASGWPPLSDKRLIQASDVADKDDIIAERDAAFGGGPRIPGPPAPRSGRRQPAMAR